MFLLHDNVGDVDDGVGHNGPEVGSWVDRHPQEGVDTRLLVGEVHSSGIPLVTINYLLRNRPNYYSILELTSTTTQTY